MRFRASSMVCLAALIMLSPGLARAADPDGFLPDQPEGDLLETACACDAAPACAGTRSTSLFPT